MTLRKSFPVFDCDAHINDPIEIWSEYVEPEYRDLVMDTYWKDNKQSLLNGRTRVPGAANYEFADWSYNPASISGPGMQDKRVLRRLQQMRTTPEQKDYLDHKGAYESHARLRDMDLMGIDQVVIIPSMILNNLPYAENAEGASVLVRAYNNWAVDYCKAAPERLFPAGLLPPQNPTHAVEEIRRLAELDFRVALIPAHGRKRKLPQSHLLRHWRRRGEHGCGFPSVRGDGARPRNPYLSGAASGAKFSDGFAKPIHDERDDRQVDHSKFYEVDCRDPGAIEAAVRSIAASGPIDSLFYCAGLPGGSFSGVDVMLVNFLGLRHMAEACVSHMKPGDAIAGISSGAGMGYLMAMERIQQLIALTGHAEARTWVETNADEDWFEGYSFSKLPYVVAIVEIEEDPAVRLMTNIVNAEPEDVRVGMPVRVVFEHHSDDDGDVWIPLFEPDPERS